jgi:hypothetical protein
VTTKRAERLRVKEGVITIVAVSAGRRGRESIRVRKISSDEGAMSTGFF